ncbi:ribonuclease inhibitor [Sphingobacterium sp.]|uniref:barstar family protein n=1 Tax=Sphingobacterium sp. TaxID=341027 RepID=UPI00289FEF58|nr:ribonuclease inhibitor [Sphingobacterium sp.]
MKKEIIIDGFAIHNKKSLFEEINRAFMSEEDWEIGESLDAINDILYGGVGTIKGNEPIRLVWKNFEANSELFGLEFTANYYKEKLMHPEVFDTENIQTLLDQLANGNGQTYMDIILEIIAEHPNIELVKA